MFAGSGAAASVQMPVVRVLACYEGVSCVEGDGVKNSPSIARGVVSYFHIVNLLMVGRDNSKIPVSSAQVTVIHHLRDNLDRNLVVFPMDVGKSFPQCMGPCVYLYPRAETPRFNHGIERGNSYHAATLR